MQKGFDQVMMTSSVIWRRANCVFPQPFDSVFFDVDGVLIKTTNSYRAANIAVTEFIVGELNGLDWGQREGKQLVTANDIELFKQAGGFNSDWDMCYLLTVLSTARLREWKGTALARRSMREWSQLAYEAAQQGQRGRAWVEQVVPASACIDYATLVDIYNESYWGADELRMRLGREPRYLPAAPGFVHNEEMLFAPDFFQRLRASGVQHLGMITGRVTAEVESATERMETYCGERWWDVIISADEYLKPDPEALRVAIGQVGALGGLYIGDTADDFELVRRYHLSRQELDPSILSAMVVHEHEVELYRQRGADILVRSVEGLLDVIPSVAR